MAISKYEEGGKILWKVYVNIRSPQNSSVRHQRKVKGIESEAQAKLIEKRLIRELSDGIARIEKRGITWGELLLAWSNHISRRSSTLSRTEATTYDYLHLLKKWTEAWHGIPITDVTRADAREIFSSLELDGKSRWSQEKFRTAVNAIFRWGQDEGYIQDHRDSPVVGLKPTVQKAEKVPEILTLNEIRKLLLLSKDAKHPWYPVWAMALLTGMRNGELHALLWTDIDFESRRISVNKSFQLRGRYVKSTKSGEWRTVPISDELLALLHTLRLTAGDRKEVLPRFWEWEQGRQARVLRQFCEGVGIKSVRFHALRACFATQLLAHQIAPARVMKICGWKDLKTMQHYVRVAGIDESGATDVLKVLGTDEDATSKVQDLFIPTKKIG